MGLAHTFRTLKPLGLAGVFEGSLALGLITTIGEKLVQAHSCLKLDSIHLHGIPP